MVSIQEQAIALFEDRLKKRDLSARKPGNSIANTPKRKYQSHALPQYDHGSCIQKQTSLFMTTNYPIVSFAAINTPKIDETSDYSELTELSEISDDERVPYALNVPRTGSNSGGTSQRRKRKKRSPYSLIVRLKYHGCDRANRNEVPVSNVLGV